MIARAITASTLLAIGSPTFAQTVPDQSRSPPLDLNVLQPPPSPPSLPIPPDQPAVQPPAAPDEERLIVTIDADQQWMRLFPVVILPEPPPDDDNGTADPDLCPRPSSAHLDLAWLAACLDSEARILSEAGGGRIQIRRSRLEAGLERVNVAFFQHGYVNSGLRVAPDQTQGTDIQVKLIIGEIGAVEGRRFTACRLPPHPLRDRFIHRYVERRFMASCAPGRPFNSYLLERDFRRLADNVEPWVARINAELRPAYEIGEATLVAVGARTIETPSAEATDMIVPEPVLDVAIGAANDRSPSVGSLRGFTAIRFRGPEGFLLDAEGGVTEGGLDGTATVTFALDRRWSIALRGDANNAEVIDPILRPLDIRSRGWGAEGSVVYGAIRCPLTPLFGDFYSGTTRRAFAREGLESCRLGARLPGDSPIAWSPARDVEFGLTLSHRVSQSFLLGQPFSFAPGSVDGRSHVTALRATLSWLERGRADPGGARGWTIAARVRASFGLDGSATDIAGLTAPSPHFFILSGQFGYARQLAERRLELTVRATGQWTEGLLYTAERFPVGGVNSVRGYPEAILLVDRGVAGSVELSRVTSLSPHRDIGSLADFDPLRFRLAVFADGAITSNLNPAIRDEEVLGSVGAGVAWIPSEAIELRVDYGLRLGRDLAGPGQAIANDGFHVSLRIEPLRLLRGFSRNRN